MTVESAKPSSVLVKWRPPKDLNGILSAYHIRWRKEDQDGNEEYEGEKVTSDLETLEETIDSVTPCENYVFYVSGETVEEGEAGSSIGSALEGS